MNEATPAVYADGTAGPGKWMSLILKTCLTCCGVIMRAMNGLSELQIALNCCSYCWWKDTSFIDTYNMNYFVLQHVILFRFIGFAFTFYLARVCFSLSAAVLLKATKTGALPSLLPVTVNILENVWVVKMKMRVSVPVVTCCLSLSEGNTRGSHIVCFRCKSVLQ